MPLFIPILLGTARDNRLSAHVARFMFDEARKDGRFETEIADISELLTHQKTIRPEDIKEKTRWGSIMGRADGLIVVSPEYNHSFPGELKLLLDELYKEYNQKPVAICGVSDGPVGGARMVQSLRLVTIALQMTPIRNVIYFTNVDKLFDQGGVITDASYMPKARALFDQIVWYAEALKVAREKR
ncbi:MAG: NAD(P)H-dependent oxidoreductase [Patescibacteria group bacterium]|nr:NAD(P)H-dependent oxidoreductase [bacterium]MDZ4240688.1 NAD(P)H-dependent oxidoreductase [Patescibacteria group bacterium]